MSIFSCSSSRAPTQLPNASLARQRPNLVPVAITPGWRYRKWSPGVHCVSVSLGGAGGGAGCASNDCTRVDGTVTGRRGLHRMLQYTDQGKKARCEEESRRNTNKNALLASYLRCTCAVLCSIVLLCLSRLVDVRLASACYGRSLPFGDGLPQSAPHPLPPNRPSQDALPHAQPSHTPAAYQNRTLQRPRLAQAKRDQSGARRLLSRQLRLGRSSLH